MNNESNLYTVEADAMKKQRDEEIGRLYRFNNQFDDTRLSQRMIRWDEDILSIIISHSWYGDIFITNVEECKDTVILQIIYKALGQVQKHILECPAESNDLANSIINQRRRLFHSILEDMEDIMILQGKFYSSSPYPKKNQIHEFLHGNGTITNVLVKKVRTLKNPDNSLIENEIICYNVHKMVRLEI